MTDFNFMIPSRDDMLRAVVPQKKEPPLIRPRWATVTQAAPLRIQMFGDPSPVEVTPTSLVGDLAVDDIVWTMLGDKGALIVVGRLNGDGTGYPVELGAGVDLDTIITPGVYTQSQSGEAAGGTNYPAPATGILEVFDNTGGSSDGTAMVWQRYTLSNSSTVPMRNVVYTRSYWTNNVWSSWAKLSTTSVAAVTPTYTADPGWTITDLIMWASDSMVQMHLTVTKAGATITPGADGNITNSTVLTNMEAQYRPLVSSAMGTTGSGTLASFYISAGGVVTLSAVAPNTSIAAGAAFTCSGCWLRAS